MFGRSAVLLVGGYEPDPLQVDARSLGPDFDMQRLALDFEPLRKLTDAVRNEFPVLQHAEVDEFRGGLPTMTPDGRLILDQVPGVNGFFVASGCCVGGLSPSSPASQGAGQHLIMVARHRTICRYSGCVDSGPSWHPRSGCGAPVCGAMRITMLPSGRTRSGISATRRMLSVGHLDDHR